MENHKTDFQPQESRPVQNSVLVGTGITGTPPPAPANTSNRKVFIIGGVLLVFMCLCVGVTGLAIGAGMVEAFTETPKVEIVIDAYMIAMADQDAGKVYTLMSTRAKRHVSLADIEQLLVGNNYMVFEGYRSLAVTDFTINLTSDPDPDIPQGEVAEVQGMISYDGGFTGDFYAVLEKEGDEWRLHGINVNVPPDKFSP